MRPEFRESLVNIAHSRKFHELGSWDQVRQHRSHHKRAFNEAVSGQGGVSDRLRQACADLVHLRRNTGPEIAITAVGACVRVDVCS
jgi:hypothetical protein